MGINTHVYSYWGVRTEWNDAFYDAYEAIEEANCDQYGYNKAPAEAQINVPATVFNSGGGEGGNSGNALGTVEQFMSMMMMQTARELQVDPTITK